MKRHRQSECAGSARKKQLLEANADEDKSISRLEKLLKMKKKKNKKLPSKFMDDGLDYILDVIDKKEDEINLSDSAISEDEDGDFFESTKKRTKKQKNMAAQVNKRTTSNKQRTLKELLKEKEGVGEMSKSSCSSDDGENSSNNEDSNDEGSNDEVSDDEELNDDCSNDDGLNDDGSNSEASNDEVSNDECSIKEGLSKKIKKDKKKPKERNKPELWEDIYGRIRDRDGNVVKDVEARNKLYVPPALRNKASVVSEQKKEELLKIQRKLKGLLNRLSEFNMQPICSQVEEMYMKNSRNNMNESLFYLIAELTLSPILTPPRLIMEQAMLVALLHANVGPEIGAYFLQHLSNRFDTVLKSGGNYGKGKECNNLIVFLSHLYNFKVSGCILIFDILKCFIDTFQDKDVELIQLLFKNVGFSLRKDNPLLLKEIIINIQSKAVTFKTEQNDSRVNFMLETLTAIRNNNMYKIPDYDPSIVERSKKVLRNLIRKGSSLQELAISLNDLLKAEEKGRWWIVGSAWAEREKDDAKCLEDADISTPLQKSDTNEKILELARKQHMNTDVRKTVFCIIMTAEDYMDAFEKLLKLNLKNQQEREIINVILHCVMQEKSSNPFYSYLAGKFCNYSRKYKISLQFASWDKFKEMKNMNLHQVNNLAQFLIHLFVTDALPLSVLKVIQLSEMNSMMVKFFRKILLAILLHESEEVCIQVFKRISSAKNLNVLREGLKIFMHHFLLRDQSKSKTEMSEKLVERVQSAEAALNSAKRAFKL